MVINENLSQINTFTGGMNTDISDALLKPDQYRYAENIRISAGKQNQAAQATLIPGVSQITVTLSDQEVAYDKILCTEQIRNFVIAIAHGVTFDKKYVNTNITSEGLVLENINLSRFDFDFIWKSMMYLPAWEVNNKTNSDLSYKVIRNGSLADADVNYEITFLFGEGDLNRRIVFGSATSFADLYTSMNDDINSIISGNTSQTNPDITLRLSFGQNESLQMVVYDPESYVEGWSVFVNDNNGQGLYTKIFGLCSDLIWEDDINKPLGITMIPWYEGENNIKLFIQSHVSNIPLLFLKINGLAYLGSKIDDISVSTDKEVLKKLNIDITKSPSSGILATKVQYFYILYNEGGIESSISPLSDLRILYNEDQQIKGYRKVDNILQSSDKQATLSTVISSQTYSKIKIYRISFLGKQAEENDIQLIYDGAIVVDSNGLFTYVDQGSNKTTDVKITTSDMKSKEFSFKVNSSKIVEPIKLRLFSANIQDATYTADELFKDVDTVAYTSGQEYDGVKYPYRHKQFEDNNYTREYNSSYWTIYSVDYDWNGNVVTDANEQPEYKNVVGGDGAFVSWRIRHRHDYFDITKNGVEATGYDSSLVTRTITPGSYDSDETPTQLRDVIAPSHRTFHPGEVYRFGIVFYTTTTRTSVKWIADIMIPTTNPSWFLIDDQFVTNYIGNVPVKIPQTYVQFIVDEAKIRQIVPDYTYYEIVMCEHNDDNKLTIDNGIIGYAKYVGNNNRATHGFLEVTPFEGNITNLLIYASPYVSTKIDDIHNLVKNMSTTYLKQVRNFDSFSSMNTRSYADCLQVAYGSSMIDNIDSSILNNLPDYHSSNSTQYQTASQTYNGLLFEIESNGTGIHTYRPGGRSGSGRVYNVRYPLDFVDDTNAYAFTESNDINSIYRTDASGFRVSRSLAFLRSNGGRPYYLENGDFAQAGQFVPYTMANAFLRYYGNFANVHHATVTWTKTQDFHNVIIAAGIATQNHTVNFESNDIIGVNAINSRNNGEYNKKYNGLPDNIRYAAVGVYTDLFIPHALTSAINNSVDEISYPGDGTCHVGVSMLGGGQQTFISWPFGCVDNVLLFRMSDYIGGEWTDYGASATYASKKGTIHPITIVAIKKRNIPYGGYSEQAIKKSIFYSFGWTPKENSSTITYGDAYTGVFVYNYLHNFSNWDDSESHGFHKMLASMSTVYMVPMISYIDINGIAGNKYHYSDEITDPTWLLQSVGGNNTNYYRGDNEYDGNNIQLNYTTPADGSVGIDDSYQKFEGILQYEINKASSIDSSSLDYQIKYSKPKENGETVESWMSMPTDNIIEVDSRYGAITCMKAFKNRLYFWQERAFGVLSVDEKAVVQSDTSESLLLGQSDVLERYDYISTEYGMKPKQFAVTLSENAIYWWDGNKKEILQFNGQVTPLATKCGIKNYLNKYNENNKPVMVFDPDNMEVLAGVVNNETVAYSEAIGKFTSVYKLLPFCYVHGKEGTLFYKGINGYKYDVKQSKSVGLDNEQLLPLMKVVSNKNAEINKTFDNIEFGGLLYGGNDLSSLRFKFDTPLKQHSETTGQNVTNVEYDYKLAIPRNGQSSDNDVAYGNRMRGKTMECQISSTDNSTDFSLQYIITKFRISWT